MIGIHARAHADADHQVSTINRHRFLKGVHQLPADCSNAFHVLYTVEHDGELVAAETRREATGTCPCSQPLRNRTQHAVAESMTEAIVDVLEIVEIHEKYTDGREVRLRPCNDGLQMHEQLTPVRQLRQWVVLGQMP